MAAAAFWDVLRDYQAMPAWLIDNAEPRNRSELASRADFTLAAGYRLVPAELLPLPITALIGNDDNWLAAQDLAEWERYTTQRLEISYLPAGHWFMEEDPAVSVAALAAEADAARRSASSAP